MPTDAELEAHAEALKTGGSQSNLRRLVEVLSTKVTVHIGENGRPYASTDPRRPCFVCALDGAEFKNFASTIAYDNGIAFSQNAFNQAVSLLEHKSTTR